MQVDIFNVEHGFCAYIVADNGNVMLVDCGHNSTTGFRPSSYLPARGCRGIERFIVSNYDEDHVSDLPNLRRQLPVQILRRNQSVSADILRRLKLQSGPLGSGIQALLDMIENYNGEVTAPPDFPDVELVSFSNSYPAFEDTNNLSLVTFLHYRDIHIVFPGDLEKAGWCALLEQTSFREHLKRVNLFVASHHGRESGYCEDVFAYCHPELAIISDTAIQFQTQENEYRKYTSGMFVGGYQRFVLTTRSDGMIRVSQSPRESLQVATF